MAQFYVFQIGKNKRQSKKEKNEPQKTDDYLVEKKIGFYM